MGLFSGGERKKVSIMNQNALQESNPEHVINCPLCYQTRHLKHLEFGMFNFHFVFKPESKRVDIPLRCKNFAVAMKCSVSFIQMPSNAAAESTFIHHQQPQTHRNVLVFITPALIKTAAINYYNNHIFYDNSGQIYLRNFPSS